MSKAHDKGFAALAKETEHYPQEQLLKVKGKGKNLQIAVPNEVSYQEQRVSLSPSAVGILVANGHEVQVEQGAGRSAFYEDNAYAESGAHIVYDQKEIFEADLIVKVEPPTIEEISWMKPGAKVFSALQVATSDVDYFEALNKKKITALAYELLEDKARGLPIVNAMSEIAGSLVIPIAAEYLSNAKGGKGIILGGITGVPPTTVVILGAGTVAEFAARAALGLGAEVRIYDNEVYKLRRIRHKLDHSVFTSVIDSNSLSQSLLQADVLIGALRPEKGSARCVVTDEMVASMKPGSVVIDVAIDQGGCIETSETTTHDHPVFSKYEIIHYCVPNIASRAARTSTTALSNILTPILLKLADTGGVDDMMQQYSWFSKGIYAYKGCTTQLGISRKFNLPFKDLSLLMAARF